MLLAASSYAKNVDFAFYFIIYTSIILLGLIVGFMLYCIFAYSSKKNPVPSQIEGHVGLETAWTIGPTIIVMLMFYYGYEGWLEMKTIPEDAMEITVIGKKWSWYYEYKVDDKNTKGSGTLIVPVDKNIKLRIQAVDVLHSFYVPSFRMKQDAVPGTDYFMWFRATEVDQKYPVFCAEYCGDEHSYMQSSVHVVSEEAFEEWLHAPIPPQELGKQLFETKGGCTVCHSLDGSKKTGPSLKGVYGRKRKVTTDGHANQVVSDDEYIKRSILTPQADIVEGFGPISAMPPQNLSEEEIQLIIDYLKTVK